MNKGQAVVMKSTYSTYCGKYYVPKNVGIVHRTVQEGDKTVEVQFGIHEGFGSSCIPIDMVELASDQKRALKLIKIGEEKGKCMIY